MTRAIAIASLLACAGAASAAPALPNVLLSEIFVNPPGTDNSQEFFELCGDANASLEGFSLVIIEGDGTAAGTIDKVLPLDSFSLGSNGLFLWRDSNLTVDSSPLTGVQGPDAGTSVFVSDFNPDIENGSNTYLLVYQFTGAINTDLDANDDGALDSAPWSLVVDALGFFENDGAANLAYADDFGFLNFGPNSGYNADLFALGTDGEWYGGDVLGTNPGGFYNFDPARNSLGPSANFTGATPGRKNLIPAPGAFALLSVGSLLIARRRR